MGLGRGLSAATLVSGLILGGGCLSVPDASGTDSSTSSQGTTEDSGSTGVDCPDGSQGCPCYGNGTCNAGLNCLEGIACFPENCTAGTLLCPCLDAGGCDVGLICEAGVCKTGGTTGPSTTAPPSTSTSQGSGGPVLPCDVTADEPECTACAKTNCCDEYQACSADMSCSALLDCVSIDTYANCLQQYPTFSGGAFDELMTCIETVDPSQTGTSCQTCLPPSSQCETGSAGQTQVDGKYDACFECAAESCCMQLTACLGDSTCTCAVQCVVGPANGEDPAACIQQCGSSPAYAALSDCAQGPCEMDPQSPLPLTCFPPVP